MSAETSKRRKERCDMPTQHAASLNRDAGQPAKDHRPCAPDVHGECAVVIADADGTVRYVSPNFESQCGYSRYEIMGKSVRDLRSGRRDAAFFGAVQDALRSGKTWTGTFAATRADGRPRVESATLCPVTDASGVVNQCVGVRREVTGDGLREEAVRKSRAMEAVARLAGGMAHNFNNLLTSIIGYSDLLLDRMANDAVARRGVKEIREAGERAAVLTRQLLAFSREQAMMPRELDLNALVGGVGRGFRARWGDGIEIRADLAEELGTVTADPDQLEQVIATLAANARDAMPRGGRLTFTTENVRLDAPFVRDDVQVPPGDYVMLAVSDTGTGMDEDIRDRIFEPFQTTNTTATGLGLAAVYGIVKQSGGYIWAFSRPGHGTTFEIYLPMANGVPGTAGAVRYGVRPPPGANRLPGGERHIRRIEWGDAKCVFAEGREGR